MEDWLPVSHVHGLLYDCARHHYADILDIRSKLREILKTTRNIHTRRNLERLIREMEDHHIQEVETHLDYHCPIQ